MMTMQISITPMAEERIAANKEKNNTDGKREKCWDTDQTAQLSHNDCFETSNQLPYQLFGQMLCLVVGFL